MSYKYPLPQLEDYDVSAKTGFLPEELPVSRLPEYYSAWEKAVEVLPSLLLTKRIRQIVDKFPVLTTQHLDTEAQWRRAYSILGFLSHAYIWGVDTPTNKLPSKIADPWIEVAEHLRIPPVATYAGLCLWNFQEILPLTETEEYEDEDAFLDNLKTISTFTGSIDESWFYLVSVYFEYKCAPCITTGLEAIKYARNDEPAKVTECLKKLAESIDYLGSVLMKMEEMCDPHVFYFKLRPYLAGWKNMSNAGLPDGVYYGDESTPRLLSGGSNAQSSSIQTLDLLLNVNHTATGEHSDESKANPFMSEMRKYMPGKHSDFLEHLAKVNILRDYVMKNASQNPDLVLAYDASVAMLKIFRDKHIRIVTRYIVIQSQKENSLGSETANKSTLRAGLAKSSQKDKVLRGTGGTALLPFLKQCRDETGNTAAGNWGKRILSSTSSAKAENDILNVVTSAARAEQEKPVQSKESLLAEMEARSEVKSNRITQG